ncbi:carph-isopro domain-containing protein [Gluconobacter cerinus]|uniref:carph-isopro domain-containing protein n=1 Tax=Gluconobacter cerinus TaxID=38307 RepID=UPI003324F81A
MAISIDVIIARFGVSCLARISGVKPPSVIGWRYRGRIPSKRIPQIIEAAKRLDPPVHLKPNDFFQLEDVE